MNTRPELTEALAALSSTVVRPAMRHWPVAMLASDVLYHLGGHTADDEDLEMVASWIAAGYPAAAAILAEVA